jgi:hypothetical protein
MAVSKTSQKQLELAGQAKLHFATIGPSGEARGLHPSFHKSMWATWNVQACQCLDCSAIKADTVDQGGYYRFCRTSRTVE